MTSNYLEELFGLSGKTAVAIGGAGVLGGALCEGLACAGAHVVVADLTEEGCKARVKALEAVGGTAGYCTVDVTRRESIEILLAETLKQTERVDILVNCAGVNAGSTFLDATDADPRTWQPFAPEDAEYAPLVHTISLDLPLPADLPAGDYRVGLWLPDAAEGLRLDPRYAVRLANGDVLWWRDRQDRYGVNVFGTLTVTA